MTYTREVNIIGHVAILLSQLEFKRRRYMRKILKFAAKKTARFFRHRIPLAVFLCLATAASLMFLKNSLNTFRIFDGETTLTVRSLSANAADVLKLADLKSDNYNLVSTKVSGKYTKLSIEYTFPVYVTVGQSTTEVYTPKATVGEILGSMGIVPDEDDIVEPSVDTVVEKTTYIDYSRVEYVQGSYTQDIPYQTETVIGDNSASGVTTTLVNGKNGVSQVNYTAKVINGVTVETVVNSTVTLSNPVNRRQVIGATTTSVAAATSSSVSCISTLSPSSPIELDANGIPLNYTKKMTVQATAYTYTGHNCATGVAPRPGYIAVNPRVIPYGTRMYIVSSDGRFVYGYAVAADTGGFTSSRPNNVDLFMATKAACSAFGRRNVEIYFLP